MDFQKWGRMDLIITTARVRLVVPKVGLDSPCQLCIIAMKGRDGG